jgi:hypothetical protein
MAGMRLNPARSFARALCDFFASPADALQLAAAFTASQHRPASLQAITLDERLADAARKEGFTLVDIAAA